MKRIALLLGAFTFAPILALAQTTVSGNVTASDGTMLKRAHVHLFSAGKAFMSEPLASVEVSPDGNYSMEVDEPGTYSLAFTGVDHEAVSTTLMVDEGDEAIVVNAQPANFTYNLAPESLKVIGDWNNFNFQSAAEMTRGEDGTFIYTFETDKFEVHYQIIGLATGNGAERSINQPGSEDYVYDGGGDYRSIMKVRPGEVSIVIDPSTLSAEGSNGAVVTFKEEWRNQIYFVDHLYATTSTDYMMGMGMARKAAEAGKPVPMDPVVVWRDAANMMVMFLGMPDQNERVQAYAGLTLVRILRFAKDPAMIGIDESHIALLKQKLPFTSPTWEIEPMLALNLATLGIDKEDYPAIESALANLYEESTIHEVKGAALAQVMMLADYRGDTEKSREIYQTLDADYHDIEMVAYYLTRLNPDRAIMVGNPVPSFEVVLEDGNGTVVTNETMKGKYYLIDFWATWCGPCVGEMPELHEAYREFEGENFEVLSLSFDSGFEKVVSFRENRYPMPWLHTFVEGGFRNELSERFEVSGIPKPVLVNPEGIIVAIEGDLRGDKLKKTLGRFLGDEQAMNR